MIIQNVIIVLPAALEAFYKYPLPNTNLALFLAYLDI